MARIEKVIEKIDKLGRKHNLGALVKMIDDPDDEVRVAVARAFAKIPTYESGLQLIPLLRDAAAPVRAAASESVGVMHAKHCEEYLKKLAYNDPDPDVRRIAHEAYNKIRTPIFG